MKRFIGIFIVLCMCVASLAGCSAEYGDGYWDKVYSPNASENAFDESYRFDEIAENGFVSTAEQNQSYFSLDRNTASYSFMRRQINNGIKINKGSVRIEEYVNYFNYDYARPVDGKALALSGGLFDCPWNAEHKLFTIGVAAEEIEFDAKANNLVFLIDTSGSMYGDDRLPLIQQAFTILLDNLDEHDTVSIVTYASGVNVALRGESGNNKTKIAAVLQDLEASGSTNGAGGIERAYEIAENYFIENGNNRVIIATDGDFNVGASSKNELTELISEKRDSGIYLSVLGVGMYNTSDTTMKTLAENGNGNYAYLDSVAEATRVLATELGGTVNVVAKDAKIAVSFNKEIVNSYRLIGYESKMLSQEEYEDDTTDAGEIGSGHTVTAVYEIELATIDVTAAVLDKDNEVAAVEITYKEPDSGESVKVNRSYTMDDYAAEPSEDSAFIGCVVEFGLVLRQSEYAVNANLENVLTRLSKLACTNDGGFKQEFKELVQKALALYNNE